MSAECVRLVRYCMQITRRGGPRGRATGLFGGVVRRVGPLCGRWPTAVGRDIPWAIYFFHFSFRSIHWFNRSFPIMTGPIVHRRFVVLVRAPGDRHHAIAGGHVRTIHAAKMVLDVDLVLLCCVQ